MMAEIKAQDVKALREKTGAGMMDCKNALDQAGGDAAKAEKILKEMGLAAVEKRVGRATNEGKIFVKVKGGKAVLLELSCETDFVARNTDFNELGARILDVVLDKGLKAADDSLLAMVSDAASKIKPNECLHAYVHGDKLCVVVKFSAQDPAVLEKEPVKALIHDVALHVAAFSPLFLDAAKVPKDYVSEQEGIFVKQMEQDEKLKGKPANVLEGIAKGKMKKHLAEICLLEQNFVKDEKRTVGAVTAQVGKDAGSAIEIADFRYFRVGQ
jgi:elongation factor Ts